MKTRFTLLAALVALSLAVSASQERKVLIIGLDGLRSDAFQQANTPHMDSLIAGGLFTWDAWHLGITVSGPSWSSIMCGVWEPKHGVTGNSYTGSKYNDYPYFVTHAKEIKPNLKAIQITEWPNMSDNVYNDGWDKKIKTGKDGDGAFTASVAAPILRDSADLDCAFVYFDQIDLTGHSTGFNPNNTAYISAIENVDIQVGKVVNAVKQRPNYANENWLILIITDHGGIGTGHGGNSNEERHIWWIASGKEVEHKQISAPDPGSYRMAGGVDTNLLKLSPVQTDIAVTALHHLIYDSGINPEKQTAWNLDGKSWLKTFTTGVKEAEEGVNMKLFPNPSKAVFTLWFENNSKDMATYTVTDVSGAVVSEGSAQYNFKTNIDLSGKPAGIYFAHVHTNGKTYTRKLILQP